MSDTNELLPAMAGTTATNLCNRRFTDDDLNTIVQDWSTEKMDQATAIGLARNLIEARALIRALSARASAGEGEAPEGRFEHYVQTAIARSPEPLRQLGEYLSRVLDEDEFPNADRLLLQIATTPKSDDLAWLEQEIHALECRHHGDPSYDHDAYWMKREVLKLVGARKSRVENE